MYVPNYIPEQLEVPGNVTLQPYSERIKFIRKVTGLHAVSVGVAAGISFIPNSLMSTGQLVAALGVLLIFLDLLRIRLRGQPKEATLSAGSLPLVLLLFGLFAKDLAGLGWPSWSLLFGEGALVLYTAVCGRDYSFVGGYFLSLIFSSVAIAATTAFTSLPTPFAGRALLLNFAFLSYISYDLASLMARRRKGEELASVTDLYRDLFNFFGYFYRCLQHWRKHQIWVTPK